MTDPAVEATTGSGSSRAERLVAELRAAAGLSEVDAYRAAFCALALAEGWSQARIGRYLGISRARVGQKIDKLNDYAEIEGPATTGTLARVMSVAASAVPWQGRDIMVRFDASDWADLHFASRLCQMVDSRPG